MLEYIDPVCLQKLLILFLHGKSHSHCIFSCEHKTKQKLIVNSVLDDLISAILLKQSSCAVWFIINLKQSPARGINNCINMQLAIGNFMLQYIL